MLWLWILLGIIGGIIVLPLMIGWFLPERYVGRFEKSFPCSAESYWAALHDQETYPVTGRRRKRIERLPDENGLPCWKEDMGPSTITIKTIESEPGTHVVREMSDSVVPMNARTEIHVQPANAGCQVNGVTEITVRKGTWHVPYFRVMLCVFNGAKLGLRDYVNRVGKGASAS